LLNLKYNQIQNPLTAKGAKEEDKERKDQKELTQSYTEEHRVAQRKEAQGAGLRAQSQEI
jgi:hypothetical protein